MTDLSKIDFKNGPLGFPDSDDWMDDPNKWDFIYRPYKNRHKEKRKMNIIEAIKSGKRFKRPEEHTFWFVAEKDGFPREDIPHKPCYYFTTEDLLADDWEIEEERAKLVITEKDVGRKIRLRNGDVDTILAFKSCDSPYKVRTALSWTTVNGEHDRGQQHELDIIEYVE